MNYYENLHLQSHTGGLRAIVQNDVGYTSILAPYGDFSILKGKPLAIYRLVTLFTITEGTYEWDPELGVKFHLYLFENLNNENIQAIRTELEVKTAKYEKDIIISRLLIETDKYTKQVILNANCIYIPDGSEHKLNFGVVGDRLEFVT